MELTALSPIAGLSLTDSNFIVGDGTKWVAESGATARTSLGLGTGNNVQFTNLTLTGSLLVDTPTLAVNLSGYTDKVGIGTATPAYKLDVTGDIRSTATVIGLYIQGIAIYSGDGTESFPSWSFINDGDTGVWQSTADTFNISTAGGERFEIDASEATFTVPILTNGLITGNSLITGGNIGISGDTDLLQLAANALTINGTLATSGNIYAGAATIGRTYGDDAFIGVEGASNPALVINDTGQASPYHLVADSDDLSIYYGTTGLISFQNNGNIGINERVPQDKLEINGTLLVKDKLKFTQDDGNEYVDSLNDGYLDYGATTAHRFNNDIDIANTKVLKVNSVQVVGAQQAHIADAPGDTAANNATTINAILVALETHGLLAAI